MTSTPSVSVLLPVRDAATTLKTAIRSIRRQTHREFEVVVVDDGSTDASPTILDDWARRDSRVRVIRRPAEGLVAALNLGLDACRAAWIARMDADDAMLPRRLEIQLDAVVEDPTLDVVGSAVRSFPRHRVGEGFRRYDRWLARLRAPEDHRRERFVESPLAHPSVLMRRQAVTRVGGYRDVEWAEDYDLWLRMLEAGRRIAKVEPVLHLWRERPDRATRSDPRYAKERFTQCRAHFLARMLRAAPTPRRVLLWGAGPTGKRLARALQAEAIDVHAFIDIDPKKVGRHPAGVPVVHLDDLDRLWTDAPSLLLITVARRGARELIRPELDRRGLVEGRDYFAAASGWIT